ncbi:hypothetical protein FKP32DRAFT_1572373, partial [Trametes sanguinea]
FETLWSNEKCNLPAEEHFEYEDVLNTMRSSMVVLEQELETGRERLNTFKPVFYALDRSMGDIRDLVRPLTSHVHQTPNATAAKSLLESLSKLQAERQAEEQRSGALFAIVSAMIMKEASLRREVLERHLNNYSAVLRSLEHLQGKQEMVLHSLKKYLGLAASTPAFVTGVMNDDVINVQDLREAYNVFVQIRDHLDLVYELHDVLVPAIARAKTQLKARLQFGITVVPMF